MSTDIMRSRAADWNFRSLVLSDIGLVFRASSASLGRWVAWRRMCRFSKPFTKTFVELLDFEL